MIAWGLSSVVSFNAQKYLVFQSCGNSLKEYLKCCAGWFLGYLLNAALLEVAVSELSLNIFAAQIIANLCSAISTYILFKKFAFKDVCNS